VLLIHPVLTFAEWRRFRFACYDLTFKNGDWPGTKSRKFQSSAKCVATLISASADAAHFIGLGETDMTGFGGVVNNEANLPALRHFAKNEKNGRHEIQQLSRHGMSAEKTSAYSREN
jgi:hypothetical protein